jgi:hypothetical protein
MALHLENLTVLSDGAPVAGAQGTLTVDSGDKFQAATARDGRLSFQVDVAPQFEEWGAELTVTAEGFKPFRGRITMGTGGHELPAVKLDRMAPPARPVHINGRRFVHDDGSPFIWRGATGFRAVEKVARGQEPDVDRFFMGLAEQGVTVVRVLSMAANMFPLRPDEGVAALPRTLDLARRRGLHVEVVGLADTKRYDFDHRAHIRAVGEICAASQNAFLEIANEPIHDTQRDEVGRPDYLATLRSLVPRPVPVALGAAHGGDDESRAFIGGDYITVHGARDDGDNGWRFVRHTNEQRVLSEETNKPVVNDEPRRDDLSPDKHIAIAVLCRMMGIGDTFHFAAGLHANLPDGAELGALKARRRGWEMIPPDFFGAYKNTGFAGSPVEEFDGATAVRMYSSIAGGDGFTLGLGVSGSDGPRCRWSGGWPTRTVVCNEGGVRVWRVGTR